MCFVHTFTEKVKNLNPKWSYIVGLNIKKILIQDLFEIGISNLLYIGRVHNV